jgi:hypothetical protein
VAGAAAGAAADAAGSTSSRRTLRWQSWERQAEQKWWRQSSCTQALPRTSSKQMLHCHDACSSTGDHQAGQDARCSMSRGRKQIHAYMVRAAATWVWAEQLHWQQRPQ